MCRSPWSLKSLNLSRYKRRAIMNSDHHDQHKFAWHKFDINESKWTLFILRSTFEARFSMSDLSQLQLGHPHTGRWVWAGDRPEIAFDSKCCDLSTAEPSKSLPISVESSSLKDFQILVNLLINWFSWSLDFRWKSKGTQKESRKVWSASAV